MVKLRLTGKGRKQVAIVILAVLLAMAVPALATGGNNNPFGSIGVDFMEIINRIMAFVACSVAYVMQNKLLKIVIFVLVLAGAASIAAEFGDVRAGRGYIKPILLVAIAVPILIAGAFYFIGYTIVEPPQGSIKPAYVSQGDKVLIYCNGNTTQQP